MASLTDVRFETLRALGYSGATSDMLLAWLQAGGPAAGIPTGPLKTVPDAWEANLKLLDTENPTFTPTGDYQRNDWWYEYLGFLGYTGNMNDRELGYWLDLFQSTTGGAYNAAYSIAYG